MAVGKKGEQTKRKKISRIFCILSSHLDLVIRGHCGIFLR